MTEFPCECVGGPKDGERWVLKEDLPEIRFATLPDPPEGRGFWVEENSVSEAKIEYQYIEYLRTRIVRNGHRLYTYYNPKR